MISTEMAAGPRPIIVQRLSGSIDRSAVEQGTLFALRLIEQALLQQPVFDLLLDLTDVRFADLQAHKAWRLSFLDHPMLQHVRWVAVVGPDTPNFRAEQRLMQTPTCRFFVTQEEAMAWLETTEPMAL